MKNPFFKISEFEHDGGSIILIDMRLFAGAVIHPSATRLDTYTLKVSLVKAEALYVNVHTTQRARLEVIAERLHVELEAFNAIAN